MNDKSYNVLFLCTGNSARSILAEAILNRYGTGRFVAFSAGSRPVGIVNPDALKLLASLNFNTQGLRSKSWEELSAPGRSDLDFVFTVCDNAAAESCPAWPGRAVTTHWGLSDPALVEGDEAERLSAFKETFCILKKRILGFIGLPLEHLNNTELRRRLGELEHS